MTYISSCQKVMNGKTSNSIIISLISDYLLEKASVLKDIYVGTGHFCYSEKIHFHYLCTSVISNHREADQKIPNHALFAISPESRVCVLFQMIPIFTS